MGARVLVEIITTTPFVLGDVQVQLIPTSACYDVKNLIQYISLRDYIIIQHIYILKLCVIEL